MQEFGKKIGWARGGLLVSAVLLAVVGVLYFVAPHGFMPSALHNPQLPEGYTWPIGEIITGLVMLITGVCLLAAYNKAGASRNLSGWVVLPGVMSLIWFVGAVVDPFLGTFSFEWVEAVFIAFLGIGAFLGAVTGGRLNGYKGWVIEMLLGLVMVVLAIAIVYNSANAHAVAGIAFFVWAVVVALIPTLGKDVKLAV